MSYVLNSTRRACKRWKNDCRRGCGCRQSGCGCGCGGGCNGCGCRNGCGHGNGCRCSASDEVRPVEPRHVIYRGPCPPNPDCAPDWQFPWVPRPNDPPFYQPPLPIEERQEGLANFTINGALFVGAGDPIEFTSIETETGRLFELSDGFVKVLKQGCYRVLFTLELPEQPAVFTEISMAIDGEEIPGVSLLIEKDSGTIDTATIEACFTVRRPCAHLEILSSEEMDITAHLPGIPIANLLIETA